MRSPGARMSPCFSLVLPLHGRSSRKKDVSAAAPADTASEGFVLHFETDQLIRHRNLHLLKRRTLQNSLDLRRLNLSNQVTIKLPERV